MRTTYIAALCVLAATSGAAFAQDENADADAMAAEVMEEMVDEVMEDETMTDEVAEEMVDDAMEDDVMSDEIIADETSEETMADDVMADDTLESDVAEDAMADEVMEEEVPSLEEIAAADPNLDVRTDEDGEVDAMVMLSDVLFSFGDASLEPAALEVLRGVAEKLDGVPSIEITGHTDAIGDADFNLALGQRRADAVRDWLIANTALTAEVISARGVGEDDPIAPNLTEEGADNPDGRALNRRVEFTLPEEG